MTTIFITLLAVVLLILVIGFFARRFLLAERDDPFEDVPSDHDRARAADAGQQDWDGGRAASPGRRSERGGAGRGRADAAPAPDRRGRGDRVPARGGRPDRADREYAADRQYDGRPPRFDEPGADRRGRGRSDRGQDDRAFEDRGTAVYGVAGYGAAPEAAGDRNGRGTPGQRGSAARPDGRSPQSQPGRPAKPGRPAPASSPAPAASRNGRASRAGGGTDWDSLSDVDYWFELASDKPLTTTAQTASAQPDAAPAAGRAGAPLLPGGRPAAAAAAQPEDSTALLPRRRQTAPGDSPALPDGRSGRGSSGGLDGNPARGARPAMPGRPVAAGPRPVAPSALDDQGPSSDQAGPAGRPDSSRPVSRRRELPSGQYGDPRGAGASRPGSAPQDGEQGIAALTRLGKSNGNGHGRGNGSGLGNGHGSGNGNGLGTGSGLGNGNGNGLGNGHGSGNGRGRPVPFDDDPLTSPSFPAIRADDSRSYRSGRPDGGTPPRSLPADGYASPQRQARPQQPAGPPTGPQHAVAQPPAPYSPGAADPLTGSGYDSRRADDGGRGENGQRGRGSWSDGYSQSGGGLLDNGGLPGSTGPNSYGPAAPGPAAAAASAGYPDYTEQPLAPANPYGSYVAAPDGYPAPGASHGPAASHQSSDVGYDSYLAGQDTRQYSQPAVPLYAAPVQDHPVHQAPDAPAPAGYGESWYGTPGADSYPSPAGYSGTGGYAGPAYADPHGNGNGHSDGHGSAGGDLSQSPNGYLNGGLAQPEYPPVPYNGQPYDPAAYQPNNPPATQRAQHDQHGYGTSDSGYGADAYGGYPNY